LRNAIPGKKVKLIGLRETIGFDSKIMDKLLPFLIWLITTILGKTWRFKVVSPPSVDMFDANAAPKVICFWHSNLLVVSYLFRHTGKMAVVSPSRDGQMAAGVARRWGHGVIFGSSRRGGASALRQSVRAIREGRSVGITPDGPKGPKEEAKPGAAQIAIAGKAPAVAIRVSAKSALRLWSWDGFLIPYPFAKITVAISEPIEPPSARNKNGGGNSNGGNSGDGAVAALTGLIQENLTI